MPSPPRRTAHALAAAAVLLAAPAALAQGAAPAPPREPPPPPAAFVQREEECLGMAFGRWTPALDAGAAGHATPSAAALAQAPSGRDWAAAIGGGRDTTLMLFPAWWPAGVHVDVPAGRRVAGDTLRGRATALVADGRRRAPAAEVRLWLVPCGR